MVYRDSIDLIYPKYVTFYAVEHDKGLRTLQLQLTANGQLYNMADDFGGSPALGSISYIRPDGTAVEKSTWDSDFHMTWDATAGTVTVTLPDDMMANAGTVTFVLSLTDEGKSISTFPMRLIVSKHPRFAGQTSGTDEPTPEDPGTDVPV